MTKYFTPVFIMLLCTGCAQSPPVQYFVLEPLSQSIQTEYYPTNTGIGGVVGIGPITLPELLRNKKIVIRTSGNTVKIAEFHQWASSLEDNFLQALTQNLSQLKPDTLFRAYPWSTYGLVDKQIIIDVIRFDTTPGTSVDLAASWTVKNEASHTVLKTGRTMLHRHLSDTTYAGTVKALSGLLADFSRELSSALLKLEPGN